MKMTQRPENLSEKEKLKDLKGKKKLQYIWDYYKLPVVVFLIFLYIIGYMIHGRITHKDVTLYTAFVNTAVSDTLREKLSDDFLKSQKIDTSKNKFYIYSDLYLTDNEESEYHQYTYASRMKILGAIDAGELDIVLMNKEAFDAFAQNGYLYNLQELFSLYKESSDLYKYAEPYLVSNTAIIKDNSLDLYFDDSITYEAETEEYPMALDLSQSRFIKNSGFQETLYLGIIANSSRTDAAMSYIHYLFPESASR